jgi:hypothetical protein
MPKLPHAHVDPKPLFKYHSLTIVSVAILALWFVLYLRSNPDTHWGSFFGNAIADWLGAVVMILGAKYLYERDSADCRQVKYKWLRHPVLEFLREHSLSVFLVVTGIVWVIAFAHMDTNGKWGQVVGNIVSEWTQALGTVFLTKRLVERGRDERKE